ncbi:MAG: C-terminal binding protein [Gammaproteobacteria bacterium]|nr:C-terminal binding protein [Gammaproteobacteria bacterium]
MSDTAKKTVAMQLPRIAEVVDLKRKYSLELEALEPVANIVEVASPTPEDFAEGAKHADAIITSWGIQIDSRIIDRLEKCVVIGLGSVGVDMVDVDAATNAGIVVTNTPDVFIEEVADHAMMLLLNAIRRTKEMDILSSSNQWFRGRPLLNHVPRLMGQTLGLVSFGNVARCTATRAKAFGLNVIAYDPYVSELTMGEHGVQPVAWGELLERSDYISVHSPHNEETEHMLDAEAFSQMKDGVVIVNTARGPIIKETDLIAAIESGKVSSAGLDVLESEPPDPKNPLLQMQNVIVTPHVASATTRMRPTARRRVGREVSLVLRGKWPMSCVNPTVLPRTPLERWQPIPMVRGPNR